MSTTTKEKPKLETKMKTTIKLLILLLIVLPLVSIAQTERDQFIGTWKVDVAKSIEKMDTDSRSKYEGLNEEVKSRASASMASRGFTFKNDGQVVVTWKSAGGEVNNNGQWVLDETARTISITVEGKAVEYSYDFLSNTELNLLGGAGIFTTLSLIKEQ